MDNGRPHSQPLWFQRESIIPRHPRHLQPLANVSSIQHTDDTLSLTPIQIFVDSFGSAQHVTLSRQRQCTLVVVRHPPKYGQVVVCATAYTDDAARLGSVADPRTNDSFAVHPLYLTRSICAAVAFDLYRTGSTSIRRRTCTSRHDHGLARSRK